VANENQIVSALSKIKKIDILVNNAGISKDSEVEKTSSEMLEAMISVNFKSVFWMAKHSVKKMNKNSCIINLGSICGLKGYAGLGIYSATKAAIISLTQTLALEFAERKIRVNAIAPGVIETDIWRKRFGTESRKILKQIEATIPLRRGGTTEEIAHAAIFLCENDFIDGATIVLDGAQTIVG
jgi:3-oxoacyl-[acyl-carrier protein] reductase